METWCRTHVTDHSGWNHRQHTLNELLKRYQNDGDAGDAAKNLVLTEYKFVSTIMASYPSHEALWCHRRYVVQRLIQQALSNSASSDQVPVDDALVSRMRNVISDTKPETIDTAALAESWGESLKQLGSGVIDWPSVLSVVLHEIKNAWSCGNKFSRRYAAWCLARLRVSLRGRQPHDEAIERELSSLATTSQKHLVQEDSVLEDLWLRM